MDEQVTRRYTLDRGPRVSQWYVLDNVTGKSVARGSYQFARDRAASMNERDRLGQDPTAL